jgi:mono/diheme cytochrome c family protein
MRKRNVVAAMAVGAMMGCGGMQQTTTATANAPAEQNDVVLLGRQMTVQHDCGACHGGGVNPAADGWLVGARGTSDVSTVGTLKTYASNLTPDVETGIGRYTERQIFNAIRYGLKPALTPDVAITSNVPGQGNFPAQPKYLAPSMPWAAWRHMTDEEIWAVAAYLKRGVKPVTNKVPVGDVPADNWASETTVEKNGPYPLPPHPAKQEVPLSDIPASAHKKVMRGRFLVASYACAGCHSTTTLDPNDGGWMAGIATVDREFQIGPFKTRPRNLTPDNTTGTGRFTERQIFNALRFGLRPGETPDVEITSTTPGEGNFPRSPKYLAPPMPWPAWRHMPDEDLWALAAYIKYGIKPVRNRVMDSEGPPDFWADAYQEAKLGGRPVAAFPTKNEVR